MYNIDNKLLHYMLNCDYTIPYLSIDSQANTLISKTLNEFMNKYNSMFNTHQFILENNDDLITLINYIILCQIRNLTDFNFKILYKPKRLKNHFNKQERFVNSKYLQKNKNCILVTSNNPIYKVENQLEKSKDSISNKIQLFTNEPTPSEIFIMQIYYCLGLTNTAISPNNQNLIGLQAWQDNPFNHIVPPNLMTNLEHPIISYVFITENDKQDVASLQEIEQADTIAMYYFEGETIPPILMDKNFSFLVKRKTNIPCVEYGNINNHVLGNNFLAKGYGTQWIGEWKNKDLSHYKEVKSE